jgi:hypothetical protein
MNSETKTPFNPRHSLIPGVMLITLGLVFLLQRFGMLGSHFNWWAIFILIPAFSSLAGAWHVYQTSGRFGAPVRSALGGGLIISTVALMFLFDLDWGKWWPLMLVAPGFAIFINGLPDAYTGNNSTFSGLLSMGLWTGLSVMLLGLTFQADRLGWINLETLFGPIRWYAIFILIPGIGALLNAWGIFHAEGRLTAAAQSLLGVGLVACAVGGVTLAGLDWNLITPIALMALGVALLAGWIGKQN